MTKRYTVNTQGYTGTTLYADRLTAERVAERKNALARGLVTFTVAEVWVDEMDADERPYTTLRRA